MKTTNRVLGGVVLALAVAAPAALAATHGTKAAHGMQAQPAMPAPECGYRHWTTKQLAALRQALVAQGYKPGAEACWNDGMRAAVTAFQKKQGLSTTGFPNRKTRKALGLDW